MAEESGLNKVDALTLRGRETTHYQYQYVINNMQLVTL